MSSSDTSLSLPQPSEDVLSFLETRRSNLAKHMSAPGPSPNELERILSIGARVPDHRKLAPWRIVLFQGQARADIGQHIGAAFKKENPDMPLDRVLFEAGRFQRAPLVVAVVSSPKDCHRGTPQWEQEMSSAIVCYNICLAAQASGYGAQWLTEWLAYDREVLTAMGLSKTEQITGFIYIGTVADAPQERDRPDLSGLVKSWPSE